MSGAIYQLKPDIQLFVFPGNPGYKNQFSCFSILFAFF